MTDDSRRTRRDRAGRARRARRRSPRELVDAAIARIERRRTRRSTRSSTSASSGRTTRPDSAAAGPFRGVPFLVKDAVCHTAGDPFHCGMRALKDADWTEPDDTWLAARFRAAGFVFVGKTNTPELATSCTTEPLAYGATHNPWDLDAQHRRLERRFGGGGRGRARAGRARQRHGRLDPLPRVDVRHRRTEADARPHHARARLRRVLGAAHPRVRADAQRARHRRRARRGRGPGPGRSVHRAAAARGRTSTRSARPSSRLRIGFRTRRRDGRRRTPTASPRSKRGARCSRSSATTSSRPTLPALDVPIDHAFGIVMARRHRARRRALVAPARARHHRRARADERDHRRRAVDAITADAIRRRARRHVDVVARACRRGGTTPTCSCCRRAPSRRCRSASSRPTTSRTSA